MNEVIDKIKHDKILIHQEIIMIIDKVEESEYVMNRYEKLKSREEYCNELLDFINLLNRRFNDSV